VSPAAISREEIARVRRLIALFRFYNPFYADMWKQLYDKCEKEGKGIACRSLIGKTLTQFVGSKVKSPRRRQIRRSIPRLIPPSRRRNLRPDRYPSVES